MSSRQGRRVLTRAAVARRRRRGSNSRRPAAAAGSRRWTAGSDRLRRPAGETSTTTTRACRRASTCRRRTSAIHDIPASSTQPASVSRPPGWPAGALALGTKVCRYNWHSAGSLGWPFPTLKYKKNFRYNIRKRFYQTTFGNCYV